MLLLNIGVCFEGNLQDNNLNTSYVTVKQIQKRAVKLSIPNLNTSYVTVKHKQKKKVQQKDLHLNTSYVTVKLLVGMGIITDFKTFKYIICYC